MSSRVAVFIFAMVLCTEVFAADEVHWTITGPTAVTVDWRGSGTAAENPIFYWIDGGSSQQVIPTTPDPLPFSSAGPFWEAEITGLTPNTLYHYRIGNDAEHTFRTPPEPGNSGFTVYSEGDIGATNLFWRVGVVQDLIANGSPNFVLLVGDLTYGDPYGMAAVDQHFNDVMVWSRDAAYMPAWGNHDWEEPQYDDLRNYKGRVDLPNSQTSPGSPSVSCCGEDWYWFDYGNARFIAYPEPWPGAWIDWKNKTTVLMDQAQADPNINFIVTFGHYPAYSSGYHAGSSTLKGILDALGDTHSKYVLNINGHSHDYERSFPQHGVTHVTVGTGGSNLEITGSCLWRLCQKPSWSAFRAMRHGALRLKFTGSGIQGDFFCGPAEAGYNDINCTVGNVIDSFAIGAGGGGDTMPPTIPTGLTATAISSSRIDLAWNASTDNVGVAGYKVNRNGSQIATTSATATSYSDTGLAPSTAYSYTVVAFDAAGNTSGLSNSASATTPADDTTAPSTPSSVTAAAVSSSSINVAWNASTDNVGVAGYRVNRDGSQIATTSATATSYSDTGLAPSTAYSYTVVAFDAAGNTSGLSNVATATTLPSGIGVTAEVRVSASADDAEEAASGTMYLTSTDLELTYDGSNQAIGMRFRAVNIPRAATITKAYVQFQVDETNSEATSLEIRGQATGNALQFTTAKKNISARPRTTAAVQWNPPAWTVIGAAGLDQRTPDIGAVVQEIVNRVDWSAGNALAIIVTGTGHRTAVAYNGVSTAAPLLHIEYQ